MRRSLKHRARRGTEGSNLVPSSGEALANLTSCARSPRSRLAHAARSSLRPAGLPIHPRVRCPRGAKALCCPSKSSQPKRADEPVSEPPRWLRCSLPMLDRESRDMNRRRLSGNLGKLRNVKLANVSDCAAPRGDSMRQLARLGHSARPLPCNLLRQLQWFR
jgi:hypothetical protein